MYFLVTFDDPEKPHVSQLMIKLRGFPNGTILDRGCWVRTSSLPKHQWILEIQQDVSNFKLPGILSIEQVNSTFVFNAQQPV